MAGAYGEVCDTLSSLRTRSFYKERQRKVHPVFSTLFEKGMAFVEDRVDPRRTDPAAVRARLFAQTLRSWVGSNPSDDGVEYDGFVHEICRTNASVNLDDMVNTIFPYVDVRGNLVPIAAGSVPDVQTPYGRAQMLNPSEGARGGTVAVVTNALQVTLGRPDRALVVPPATSNDGRTLARLVLDGQGEELLGFVAERRGRRYFTQLFTDLPILLTGADTVTFTGLTRAEVDERTAAGYMVAVAETAPRQGLRQRVWRGLAWVIALAGLGGHAQPAPTALAVASYFESSTQLPSYMTILVLGGLNPKTYNILAGPIPRLTSEEFFQLAHEALPDLVGEKTLSQFIFESDAKTKQTLAYPRMQVNPSARSVAQQQPRSSALKEYMRECHNRGRNLYIMCLAFFLRNSATPDPEADPELLTAFMAFMVAAYTVAQLESPKSSDARVTQLAKRQKLATLSLMKASSDLEDLL